MNKKFIVLVIYERWVKSNHALLDDYKVKASKIVEVENLLDLNEKFKNILEIKILKEWEKENIHDMEKSLQNTNVQEQNVNG